MTDRVADQPIGGQGVGNATDFPKLIMQAGEIPCAVPLEAPTAGEVALGQVVRYRGMCRGPAGQFSGRRPEAHAGR